MKGRRNDSISKYQDNSHLYYINTRPVKKREIQETSSDDSDSSKSGNWINFIRLFLKYSLMVLLFPFYVIYIPLKFIYELLEKCAIVLKGYCEVVASKVKTITKKVVGFLAMPQAVAFIKRQAKKIAELAQKGKVSIKNGRDKVVIVTAHTTTKIQNALSPKRYVDKMAHFFQSIPKRWSKLYQEVVGEIRSFLPKRYQ